MASPLPPQLLAALAAGHGGAPMMNAPQPDESDSGDQLESVLTQIAKLAASAMHAPGVSSAEGTNLARIAQMAQQGLAQREKEEQAALGGGPATNYLQRTVGGR